MTAEVVSLNTEDLKINLDRVSHMVSSMWMEGHNGYGKLKILPTPMGKLVETMLQSGVKLGVSSRGSGNVDEGSGNVSEFDIISLSELHTDKLISIPGFTVKKN